MGDGLYARLEVDFVRSFRWASLKPGARCLFIFLWVYSLEKRRGTLERPTNNILASQAGLTHHPITSYLRLLHDCRLLYLTDNHIHMLGIHEKHKQFQWKDEPFEINENQTEVDQKQTPPIKKQKQKQKQIQCIDGKFQPIEDKDLEEWENAYPLVEIRGEILRIALWWDANPTKVRGRKGARGTITRWFAKNQKEAMESGQGSVRPGYRDAYTDHDEKQRLKNESS